MISLQEFKDYLSKVEESGRKVDEISEVLGGAEKLCEAACTDDVIQLLETIFDDHDGDIDYWVWELDFGRKWKPGCVTDINGNGIKFETVEDLYNYLTGNSTFEEIKDDGGDESHIVFCVESGLSHCPDFELTYHPATDDYTMSLETIYQFESSEDAAGYLYNIQEQFQEWMKANHYNTHHHINLYRLFEACDNMHTRYKTIDEAYAMLTALVCGACFQGVDGETYKALSSSVGGDVTE